MYLNLKPNRHWISVLVIVLLMIHWFVLIHRISVLIGADGAVYLETAGNLLKGKGLYYLNNGRMIPYVFWPPLYPFSIYLLMKWFGVKSIVAAIWITGTGLFLSLIMMWRLLKRLEIPLVYIIGFLVAFSGSWLYYLYFRVLSETVYLALFLGLLHALIAWIRWRSSKRLIIMGLILGLLLLTKYAAMGLAAGLAWIIWKKSKGLKTFVYNLLMVIVPALILFFPWYIHTKIFAGSSSFAREIAIHWPGKTHWFQWTITLVNFYVPGLTKILGIPVAFLLLYSIVKYKSILKRILIRYDYLWQLALIFFLFILVAVSFVDYDIPLDIRILAPFFMISGVMTVIFFVEIPKKIPEKFLIALILFSHLWSFGEKNIEYWHLKNDYVRYRNTPFIDKIRAYNQGKIWCNVADVLKVYVENDTLLRDYPPKFNRMTLKSNSAYEAQMLQIKETLRHNRGIVVYFYGYEQRSFLPDIRDLMYYFSGFPVLKFDEGIIILPPDEYSKNAIDSVD